jgi:4-hydroxymandelate oxidase
MISRRIALAQFAAWCAASPLRAQNTDPGDEAGVDGPVNVHEFELVARRKLSRQAWDFIAGGVEDEQTLHANEQAFARRYLVPRVMTNVAAIDMKLKLLGQDLDCPLLIAPTGGKNLVLPRADEVVARAALAEKILLCSSTGATALLEAGEPLLWWTNTIGHETKAQATTFARRMEENGCRGIVVTVDNQYQSNRDRNNRNRFDYGYMSAGVPTQGEVRKPVNPALPAMWQPHTPSMTWDYLGWLKSACQLPVLVKGVLAPEDALLAVQHGADAIVVSNHGGRQMDGVLASLDALPDVVAAAAGRLPVLMDGGIRRGSDMVKAMALGADAVLLGRAPLWGLGAYGEAGVRRVLSLLRAEFRLGMALCGAASLADLKKLKVRAL